MQQTHTCKFQTGAQVFVMPTSLTGPRTGSAFEILNRYSVAAWQPLYRIRSLAGSEERVVPENELLCDEGE